MIKIGIIAAMKPEVELLYQQLENVEVVKSAGIVFYKGFMMEKEIVVSECGIGKVNAAMAATIMITEFDCNLLINTGIAGGIGLKPKDVVIASKLMYYDFDTTIFGYDYGQVPGMPKEYIPSVESVVMVKSTLNKLGISYVNCPVYSGDQFVSSMDTLQKIKAEIPSACEMEGAAIAQVAIRSGVDFLVLRFISDAVGEENQIQDYLSFEKEMAEQSSKICLQIMNNL